MIKLYQQYFSRLLRFLFGPGCRFTPTCSDYTVAAIDKYGWAKGSFLSVKRLLSCHPLVNPGFDPVK